MALADLCFLVVEDHDFQRRALAKILASMGAKEIHEAPDGHAALKIIQDATKPVDMVISDLDMPGMDGMEFIRRLGEARARVSLIIASALERNLIASIATMTRAYGVTLLGIVEKPLTSSKLETLIGSYKPAPAKPPSPKATGPSFTLEEIAAGLKNDEFEPFFQPKIDLATGNVKGAEALARWRHPRHGIVAPYAFIGPVEENGLIDELTWIMLRKAAALCSTWRREGLKATVSVNLSLKSLGEMRLAERVTELVRGEDLDPHHMVLEVTESSATTEIGAALENLARLRLRGFGLSIDDYGTGYSSMQQLMRIAFTELKIDRSFVTNAAKQESARVILESSLDMAKKLDIAAVAEGVETQEDWDLLREFGCCLAQGYFIARPMESGAYLQWVRAWKPRSAPASALSLAGH